MLRKKENGVVLLSCLVFLLMLLALLSFTINSAKMEEMKAGADFDQMSAKEAANIAMLDAEFDIKRIKADGTSLVDPSVKDENKKNRLAIQYWANPANFAGRVGVFDGDASSSSCTSPLYADKDCVKWLETSKCDSSGVDGGAICVGSQTDSSLINRKQGKYIIERFMGNGPVLKMGALDKEVVILRVTAVGFSKPEKNGDNTSRVMLQNTYVLSQGI